MKPARLIALALVTLSAILIPATALSQDPDDHGERTTPTRPHSLRLYESSETPGQLKLSFTPGLGATIHEFQITRSATESGTYTDHGGPVLANSSPANLGSPGFGYWYRVKARACDDDDNCSSYAFSNKRQLTIQDPPVPSLEALANGPANISLTWKHRTGIAEYQLQENPDPSTQDWTDISIAATAVAHEHTGLTCGTSRHYQLRARGDGTHYNNLWTDYTEPVKRTTDSCTIHNFSPDPIKPSNTSNAWTVPAGITELALHTRIPGESGGDRGQPVIEILVHSATGTLTNIIGFDARNTQYIRTTAVTAGSRVTVRVPVDSHDEHQNLITMTLYPGQNLEGAALARARIQRYPAATEPPDMDFTFPPVVHKPEDDTITLSWTARNFQGNPEDFPFRIQVASTEEFTEADIFYRDTAPGSNSQSLTITEAWEKLGPGDKYIRVQSCNTHDVCKSISRQLELIPEIHTFTPNPLEAGGTSDSWWWPVRPALLSNVYAELEGLAPDNTISGNIRVQTINIIDNVDRELVLNLPSDNGSLPYQVTARRVRVAVDEQTTVATPTTIRVKLRWGSSTGAVIAQAFIELKEAPATPLAATTPSTLDAANDTLTFNWTPGTHPAGVNPDHYRVAVPEFDEPFQTTSTTLTVSDITEEVSDGAHTAEVRHCVTRGPCSPPLEISFTIPQQDPKVRLREHPAEVGYYKTLTFRAEAFNLATGTQYSLKVTASQESDLSLSNACPGVQFLDFPTFTAATATETKPVSARACNDMGGTITAEVLGADGVVIDTYQVQMEARYPRIRLSGFENELHDGSSINIQVDVSGLLTDHAHQVRIQSNSPNIGFAMPCAANRTKTIDIPQGNNQHSASITLHSCGPGQGIITTTLRRGNTYFEPPRTISLTVGPPSPITIFGPNPELSIVEDTPHQVTVSGTGLDPSANYTLTGNTRNPILGFDENCLTQESRTIPAGSTSFSETFTIYGCLAIEYDITFTLEGDNSDTESTFIDIRVTKAETVAAIALEGLPGEIEKGDNQGFTVKAQGLTPGTAYTLAASATIGGNLGFEPTCTTTLAEEDFTPTGAAHSINLTIHACADATGIITASLSEQGETSTLDTVTQAVTVKSPALDFTQTSLEIPAMGTTTIGVAASGLVSTTDYFLRLATNSAQLGFATPCTANRETFINIPSGSVSHSQALTLHSCGATTGSLTAHLYHGHVDLMNPSVPPGSTAIADATLVTETELTLNMTVSESRPEIGSTTAVTLTGQGLNPDPTVTYSLAISADSGKAGFDASCTTTQTLTGPSTAATFSETAQIHTCLLGAVTLTATLTGSDGENTTASLTLTVVNPLPQVPQNIKHIGGDGEIRLDWTFDPHDEGYEIQQLDGPDWKTLPFGSFRVNITDSKATVTGVANGTGYQHRVRSLNRPTGDSSETARYSAWSSPVTTTPVRLDIEPKALRKALLTWTEIPGTSQYKVLVKDPAAPISDTWETVETAPASDAPDGYMISLDEIFTVTGRDVLGLAHHDEFTIRVDAEQTDAGGTTAINQSVPIRIQDNPLLTKGGRAYAPSTSGTEAELTWAPVNGATNQEIRYRQLGNRPRSLLPDQDHSHPDWPNNEDWPYYQPEELAQVPDSPGAKTLTGLKKGEIYAVRINYAKDGEKVFSARDAYVWPSDDFPGNNERVATYPFFGHHPNREFEYIICQSKFPTADWLTWQRIITNGFDEWDKTTNNFVTTSRRAGKCATGPLADFIETDEMQNEVRMVDLAGDKENIYKLPELKSDVFKICIQEAPSCVTSFSGYSGLGDDPTIRPSIAQNIEDYIAGNINKVQLYDRVLPYFWANHNFLTHDREGMQELIEVDITLNKRYFGSDNPPTFPGQHTGTPATPTPNTDKARFNTCLTHDGKPEKEDREGKWLAYHTAVHEAGHALGISGISNLLLWQSYEDAHPTIPDSALNYDYETESQRPVLKHPDTQTDFSEPDCSPHPFDILAIYALYQKAR